MSIFARLSTDEMREKGYDPRDAASIFAHSRGLIGKSLAEAVMRLNPKINTEDITSKGKGGLGQLVEKFYYGYEPNSDPRPDFHEAGVELKTTPLKRNAKNELTIKERLVCDMIDYCAIVNIAFEDSPFFKKSLMMLILFYLHVKGEELRNLKFLFSVLWQLKEKDLLIIKHDYEVIVSKIRAGKAHELSEGDTMYLGACRKGQKDDALRKQPYNEIRAPKRAFALKPAYMRTILDFVLSSGKDMVTNTNIKPLKKIELVTAGELESSNFEEVLTRRLMAFKGMDYRQIAAHFGMKVSMNDKSRYARVAKRILSKGLKDFDDAEEISKAGIIAKTIRLEINGDIKESMSFENIDYDEIYDTDEWTESRWYEIATSRFLFIVFRAAKGTPTGWDGETRYTLDKVIFWTMPGPDLRNARDYWLNIKANVTADTLQDDDNSFWKISDARMFHVRPKAQKSKDKYTSPASGKNVPKKAYWFNKGYVREILRREYGKEWDNLFETLQA